MVVFLAATAYHFAFLTFTHLSLSLTYSSFPYLGIHSTQLVRLQCSAQILAKYQAALKCSKWLRSCLEDFAHQRSVILNIL